MSNNEAKGRSATLDMSSESTDGRIVRDDSNHALTFKYRCMQVHVCDWFLFWNQLMLAQNK